MANRQSVKSNIISKLTALVTIVKHRDILNSEIADNVVFKEDVAIAQSSSASNITVDFSGKDRVDLTRTGGSLNITVSNIGDGQDVDLLITKTAGQAVTFTNVTDITPIKANANALSIVLYRITRKSSNFYAKAWVENVKTATDTIEGVLETATQAESNALSATNKIVTPGRQPIATTSQKGLVELATSTEANALSDTTRPVTPGTIPQASTSQKGVIEVATAAQVDAGTAGNLAVIASELKRKYDDLVSQITDSQSLSFTGSQDSNFTSVQLVGNVAGKVYSISGEFVASNSHVGTYKFLKTISGYVSPGYNHKFCVNAKSATLEQSEGFIDTSGNIYISVHKGGSQTWVFQANPISA